MSEPPKPTVKLQNDPDRAPFEITKVELLDLVKAVDKLDPIDFAELRLDENEYLGNVTESVMNMLEQMQQDSPKNWTITLIASLTKTVAENGVLEARLSQALGSPEDATELLRRFSKKG